MQQETFRCQTELVRQVTLAKQNQQQPPNISQIPTPIASGILATPSGDSFPPNYNPGNTYVAMQQGSQQIAPPTT